jgi:hypothetical protein
MPGEPPKKSANSQLFEYSSCKFVLPPLFKDKHIRTNTIGIVNVHIFNPLPGCPRSYMT